MGNPNPELRRDGNLFEGARGWFHFVAGCNGAQFALPTRTLSLYLLLGFCSWYYIADSLLVPQLRILKVYCSSPLYTEEISYKDSHEGYGRV